MRDSARDNLPPRSSRDEYSGTGYGGGSTGYGGGGERLGGSGSIGLMPTLPSRSTEERRATRLLYEVAGQCTLRDPVERPTAWAVLTRLMRYMEQPSSGLILRCDATRQAIPLSATHANKMLEARAADSRLAAEEHSDDGGRRRKRRRDESGSRRDERSHKSKHGTDTRHDEIEMR